MFKGTIPPKNYKKKNFLLLMKYQHVADIVVKLYSLATCVKGVGGIERHYFPSIFKTITAEKLLSWKFSILQLLKSRTLSLWATGLILVSKEAKICDLQSYRKFFLSIFEFWKKIRRLEFQFFRQENIFFEKNCITQTKIKKLEKKTVVL